MEKRKRQLGFPNCLAVETTSNGDNLALLWNDDVLVTIVNYSKNHIHAAVELSELDQTQWFFMGIYRHLESHNKHLTWKLMSLLNYTMGVSKWLIYGDFNEVIDHNEKWGGCRKIESQLDAFKEAIS